VLSFVRCTVYDGHACCHIASLFTVISTHLQVSWEAVSCPIAATGPYLHMAKM